MIELEKPAEKKNPRSILLMENESDSSEKLSKSFYADDLNKKVSLNGFLQGDHIQVYCLKLLMEFSRTDLILVYLTKTTNEQLFTSIFRSITTKSSVLL